MKSTVFTIVSIIIAAALLAGLSVVLQGPIEKAELDYKSQTYLQVWPDAAGFGEIDGIEGKLAEANAQLVQEYNGASVTEALAVLGGDGATAGYVLTASSPNGYGGELSAVLAVQDGKVTGFMPVVMNETPGFGAECSGESYRSGMAGVASPDQVDAISGATITTNAIKELVGAALAFAGGYAE